MWNGSINEAILIETIVSEIEKLRHQECTTLDFKESLLEIQKRFPNLSKDEVMSVLNIAIGMYNYKNNERIDLVVTAPKGFNFKARKTSTVVYDLIYKAQKNITITGYSISDYVSDLIELIVEKSRKGIYVNIYLNNFDRKIEQLEKVLIYRNKYINIYDYNKNSNDKMAALHAKVITTDGKYVFISSSNLSYHGIEGNIEMGVLIKSTKKASELENLFKQLRYQKIFLKV